MTPTVLHHMIVSSVDFMPTFVFPWKPNARPELLPEAGARHERTLEAVSSRPLFGSGYGSQKCLVDFPVNPPCLEQLQQFVSRFLGCEAPLMKRLQYLPGNSRNGYTQTLGHPTPNCFFNEKRQGQFPRQLDRLGLADMQARGFWKLLTP